MSTFQIGATTADFLALEEGFGTGGGVLEETRLTVQLADADAWGALFSLRSWDVSVESLGETAHVDYHGAGPGTLSLDEADVYVPKTAILSDPKLTYVGPDDQRLATVTFTILEDA